MSLSNFSSPLAGSSAVARHPGFPEPVAPDVVRCDAYWNFHAVPQAEYCWEVWSMLPQGTDEQTWYTKPTSPRTTNRLPLELGDGM